MQWREGEGFGISSSLMKPGLGEAPDEREPDLQRATERVLHLLRTRSYSTPPSARSRRGWGPTPTEERPRRLPLLCQHGETNGGPMSGAVLCTRGLDRRQEVKENAILGWLSNEERGPRLMSTYQLAFLLLLPAGGSVDVAQPQARVEVEDSEALSPSEESREPSFFSCCSQSGMCKPFRTSAECSKWQAEQVAARRLLRERVRVRIPTDMTGVPKRSTRSGSQHACGDVTSAETDRDSILLFVSSCRPSGRGHGAERCLVHEVEGCGPLQVHPSNFEVDWPPFGEVFLPPTEDQLVWFVLDGDRVVKANSARGDACSR